MNIERDLDAVDTAVMSSRMWIATVLFVSVMGACLIAAFAVLAADLSEAMRTLLLAMIAIAYATGLFASWRSSAWLDARHERAVFEVMLRQRVTNLRRALSRRAQQI